MQPCVSPSSIQRSGRRGTTLVEMMVVMAVMLAAASIFSQMVIATAQLREVQRENAIAAEAARVLIEQMRNEEFRHLFFRYNQDPLDDPAGAGTAPGHRFLVRGLNSLPGSPDGLQMEVIFPAFAKEVESTRSGEPVGEWVSGKEAPSAAEGVLEEEDASEHEGPVEPEPANTQTQGLPLFTRGKER